MVSEDWAGIMGDIGGQIKALLTTSVPAYNTTACPVPASAIDIQHYTINLPEVPSVISFFAEVCVLVCVCVFKITGYT